MEGNVVGIVLQRSQAESVMKELEAMLADPAVQSIVLSVDDNEKPSPDREMFDGLDSKKYPKVDALLAGEIFTLGISTNNPYSIVKLIGTTELRKDIEQSLNFHRQEQLILAKGFDKCPIL